MLNSNSRQLQNKRHYQPMQKLLKPAWVADLALRPTAMG